MMVDRKQSTVALFGIVALGLAAASASAQRIIPQPVTDSAAEASPINRVTGQPVNDAASQDSPAAGQIGSQDAGSALGGAYVAPHTPIAIELAENIDSGFLQQGQNVKAHLSAPLRVHGGPTLPAGTPVQLNVIASVPAGRIMSAGEFSLQVLRVGKVNVYTNTLVFDGKTGRQDLPDSNPEVGTDAGLPNGSALTFHVLPAPTDDVNMIQDVAGPGVGPGSVHAIAPGGAPPASQLHSTYTDPNAINPGRGSVSAPNTTTNQQIQNLNQARPAPSQMTSPTQPIGSTTPR